MKSTIKFIKAFADKKKGEEWECDGSLASQLVNKDKVAEYTGETLERQKAGQENTAKAEAEEAEKQGKIKNKLSDDAKAEAKAAKDEAKRAAKLRFESLSPEEKKRLKAKAEAAEKLKELEAQEKKDAEAKEAKLKEVEVEKEKEAAKVKTKAIEDAKATAKAATEESGGKEEKGVIGKAIDTIKGKLNS